MNRARIAHNKGINLMTHRSLRGTIRYTSRKPERMHRERGREYFTITTQADATIVMQAHCEIDDAPNVVRDVVVAMDRNAKPYDCSVRLSVGDRFEGSGWMRFTDTHAECETYNRRDGRITQRLDLKAPATWIQAHPLVGDGLLMKLYDLQRGPGKQRVGDILLTSPDHRGATGPLLFPMSFSLVYVGDEEVTVAAGTFAARHFQVTDTADGLPEEHPPYDVWVSADNDYLFLKGQVQGYMQTYYELVELRRD
jgi:hypothetical protein